MTTPAGDALDAFNEALLRDDGTPGPTPEFVARLRADLRAEARHLAADAAPPLRAVPPTRVALAPRRPMPALRGIGRAMNHATAIALIGVVLIVSVTTLGNRGGSRLPESIPAAALSTPSPAATAYADVAMSGGNAARTNVQPGPGLASLPTVAGRSDVAGLAMALSDGILVISSSSKATALDAATLRTLWSVDLPGGAYSPPAVAGGRIVFGFARNTEAGPGKAAENQLIALSLQDGHEVWRTDGAGTYSSGPIVAGETVYALGVADGRYVLGAYRASDGATIWRSDVGPFAWCCPAIGIALDHGVLAVSDADTLSAFDAATGARLWNHTPQTGEFVGTPLITAGMVIANSSDEFRGDTSLVTAGATSAYDLRSGDIRWSNPSARSFRAALAVTPGGILYAGPWGSGNEFQFALLETGTGQTAWAEALPDADYGGQAGTTAIEADPVIVGETAYVVTASSLGTGAPNHDTLLTALDVGNREAAWTAQIDGGLASAPIVAGGRIFVLTFDAGLIVLGDGGQPATVATNAVDLRRTVACNAPSGTSPMLGSLPATPSIPGVAAWKQPIRFSQIPSGVASNVDPQTAAQLKARFDEYRACSQADPYTRVFGFFSTDFYIRLLALDESLYNGKAQPWAVWMASMQEYLSLDTDSLQMLPDGRIGGLINSPVTNVYVWWVQEDGVWKIDEYHRVLADPVDPNAPAPAPSLNPEGTPYG